MALRKFWGIIGLLLLLGCAGYVLADAASPSIFLFQGDKVSPEVKWIVKNNVKYVNLPFFTKQLGTQGAWRPDTGVIQLQIGKNIFSLEEDRFTYLLDKSTKQLTAAPFEKEGQLWLPLELLPDFGVAVKFEDQRTLELGWTEDYLLGIASSTYEGRPALIFTGSKPLQQTSFLLKEPDRLVINLNQVKAHPSLDSGTIQNQLVKQVRFNQFDNETLRIVCDLEKADGYQIISAPNQPNRLIIVFNYFLQAVNVLEEAGVQKIQIKTDSPAEYTVKKLTNPARAVIDFDNATLGAPMAALNGNRKWFNQVRVSQFNLKTVRVVVDLTNANSLFKIVRSRVDPKLLEIRTVQYVKELKLESTPVADKLIVTGSDELEAEIIKLRKSSLLYMNLDFCRFQAQLKTPLLPADSQLKGIRLLTLSPTAARVEIEYKYFVGYEVEYSPDARQLTISLLKSPLVNRTLVIDAGHGGEDMGATGKQGNREKQINLDVTMRLRERLQEAGANVLLT
ncbi:MAG TPA: N-acetylmuramoyl-L-alanine amidase, partial [Bacillota bacterium]|nr:N-acetylmuramoyl-L-alanine amidase [Bacillota bacterium]